jgi:hypothetical protein
VCGRPPGPRARRRHLVKRHNGAVALGFDLGTKRGGKLAAEFGIMRITAGRCVNGDITVETPPVSKQRTRAAFVGGSSPMIELNDFIAEAVTSIVRGIQQGQASDVGDHIAPLIQGEKRNEFGNFHLKGDTSSQATIVQFDVQVTTERHTEGDANAKAKFRLYVVDLQISGSGKREGKSSNLHRLQFSIPIKIPNPDAKK